MKKLKTFKKGDRPTEVNEPEKAEAEINISAKESIPVSKGFDVEGKMETIKASSMPQSQKEEMIARLSVKKEKKGNRISFKMYANIKNIREEVRSGMLALPKAKNIGLATLSEWDGIFKDF